MTWGENHADGRPRVYMRRVTGTGPSAFPQELSLPDLGGQPGGRADSADIDIEDDGSFAWAVFRQDFGGGSRSVARRLLGSTFDPAVPLDGGPATTAPRIAMNGRGQGLAALETAGGGVARRLQLQRRLRARPVAALVGLRAGRRAAAGLLGAPRGGARLARRRRRRHRLDQGPAEAGADEAPFQNEVELSRPDLGPVAAGAVRRSAPTASPASPSR